MQPRQPTSHTSSSDKSVAVGLNLFAWVPGIPVVGWLLLRRRSRYLSAETAELASFNVSFSLYALVAYGAQALLSYVSATATILLGIVWLVFSTGWIIESVRGAYHALRGRHTWHPFTIRMFREQPRAIRA